MFAAPTLRKKLNITAYFTSCFTLDIGLEVVLEIITVEELMRLEAVWVAYVVCDSALGS